MAAVHRRAWFATKVFVVLSAVVIAGVFLYPPTYRSEAVVQLPSMADARLAASRLTDRATLETLASEFKLSVDRPDAPMGSDRTIAALGGRLHVDPIAGDTVHVSFDAGDGPLAQQVVDRLSQMAIAVVPSAAATGSGRFLDAELAEADTLLATQQERLQAYHDRHPNEDASHFEEASRELQRAQTESQTLAIVIARDRERLQNRPRVPAPPAGLDARRMPAPTDPLMMELVAARAMLTDMLGHLTPAHPDVARQQELIRDLESRIGARAPTAPSPGPRASASSATDEEGMAISQRIAATEAQRRRVIDTIGRLRATLDAVPEAQAELIALTRDYEAVQRLRAGLVARSEALATESAGRQPVARVLTPARVPERPTTPNRRQALAVGLTASLLVALAAATIQERHDTRVHDRDDLRALSDVPILAVLHEVVTLEETAKRRVPAFFRALVGPALAAGIALAWWWAQ
jgi:uncharacterized protein involved in exopolysaccharide biosynthesis